MKNDSLTLVVFLPITDAQDKGPFTWQPDEGEEAIEGHDKYQYISIGIIGIFSILALLIIFCFCCRANCCNNMPQNVSN